VLSERERMALAKIERQLVYQDPELAARFVGRHAGWGVRLGACVRRTAPRVAVGGFTVGVLIAMATFTFGWWVSVAGMALAVVSITSIGSRVERAMSARGARVRSRLGRFRSRGTGCP
jgi:uncharacterized membrane protein